MFTSSNNSISKVLYRLSLQQHVEDATHEKGHTLDLVITHEGNILVSDLFIHAPTCESDHFPVTCKLKIKKVECQRKVVSYRKTKDINIDHLREDIKNSNLQEMNKNSVDDIVDQFNSVLSNWTDLERNLCGTKETLVR